MPSPSQADALFLKFRSDGDRAALESVFLQVAPDLRNLASRLATADSVEDLIQATFVTAIEDAPSFDASRPLHPWLRGILTNHAHKFRRTEARSSASWPQADSIRDPETEAMRGELQQAVALGIRRLPAPYGEVIRLHLEDGLLAKQIAPLVGSPPGTVRSQVVRGLLALHRLLPRGLASFILAALSAGRLSASATKPASRTAAAARLIPALILLTLVVSLGYLASIDTNPNDHTRDHIQTAAAAVIADTAPAKTEATPRTVVPSRPQELSARPEHGDLKVTLKWADGRLASGQGIAVMTGRPRSPARIVDEALGKPRVVRANANGQAVFVGVPFGSIRLRPLGGRQSEAFLFNHQSESKELNLGECIQVMGDAVDTEGKAIAGARIYASDTMTTEDFGDPVAQTKADGTFSCELPGSQVGIWCETEDGQVSAMEQMTWSQGHPIHLRVKAADRHLNGQVHSSGQVQSSGRASDVVVLAYPSHSQRGELFPVRRARCNPQGGFAFTGLPERRMLIIAASATAISSPLRVDLRSGSAGPIDLRLRDCAQLRGRVLDQQGQPRAGVHLALRAPSVAGGFSLGKLVMRQAISDASGAYAFSQIPPGEVMLQAFTKDATRVRQDEVVLLSAGTKRKLDLHCEPLQYLSGALHNREHQAQQGWLVHATPVRGGSWQKGGTLRTRRARTDALGRFALCNLLIGAEYKLKFYAPTQRERDANFYPYLSQQIRWHGKSIERQFLIEAPKPARVSGRLLSARAGEIRLTSDKSSRIGRYPIGAEGVFSIKNLPPASYELVLSTHDGHAMRLPPITLHPGEDFDVGELDPELAGRLRITFAEARPPGTVAKLVHGEHEHHLRPGLSGAMESGLLPVGNYELRIEGSSTIPLVQDLTLAPGDVELKVIVRPGVPCTFTMPYRSVENPYSVIGPVHVRILDADGQQILTRYLWQPEAVEFEFTQALLPGRYQLEAVTAWDATTVLPFLVTQTATASFRTGLVRH